MAQSLLDVIADVALAHGAANIERHRRHYILGSLAGEQNTTDLGAITVDNGHLIAIGAQLCDILAGLLNDFQLCLCSGGTVFGLQGVAAQSDDNLLAQNKFLLEFLFIYETEIIKAPSAFWRQLYAARQRPFVIPSPLFASPQTPSRR